MIRIRPQSLHEDPDSLRALHVGTGGADEQNEPSGQDDGEQTTEALASVRQLGEMAPPHPVESAIHCLTVIGQIEGHMMLPPKNKTTKYEHVIPQLVAIEQSPRVKGLLIVLNTVGGDIEAGLAIAEMVRTLSKPTVSLVLGGGHSIGAPIAVAADYCFVAETATITIHPIRLTGLVIGVPQTYEYLDKMQDRVIRFMVENSKITQEKLRELMFRTGELVRDIGTVLIGREAVSVGMADDVGGISEAVCKLNELIQRADGVPERAAKDQVAPLLPQTLQGPGMPDPNFMPQFPRIGLEPPLPSGIEPMLPGGEHF